MQFMPFCLIFVLKFVLSIFAQTHRGVCQWQAEMIPVEPDAVHTAVGKCDPHPSALYSLSGVFADFDHL